MEDIRNKIILVDSNEVLQKNKHFLRKIKNIIYVDLEGINLGKNGSITLLQIYIPEIDLILIYDFLEIKDLFTRCPELKEIFESPRIQKKFFDFRSDINALYFIYNIDVQCVDCIQVRYMAEMFEKNVPSEKCHGLIHVFEEKLNNKELIKIKKRSE